MSERRAGAKGRRLGSSRRKQLQEGPGEEPPWTSEIVQRVQHLLSDRDTEQAGVVTRSDMQKLQEEGLPCSREELELVFDGLDAAGIGRLGTEEFTAGLRQFLSSQKAAREHRRRKTASRRVRLVLPALALEGGDSEERRHFSAFMEQLGTDNISEEQEIWQLWVKLRQDEPQLLDNLEEFLAKMRHRIQEARSEKEALELALNKRVAEHDKDVQQLCEVLEQQIQQEQLRLQQQSMTRSQQQGEELQRVLDASEREVQRLVTAQMELERRCRSLHSSQQVTSTENQQLQESNQALQQHLQHLHQQLQQTQGHLRTMRATVAWEHVGEPGDRVVAELPIEVPMSPQLSPGKSEKFRSEMRIRLGSQSGESKAKSTHQVVWEMLPAEINPSGAPWKASSAEEDPFPEPLKEEGVSDQSSLLREMNDAIAALSKHLKAQALGAPPALADTPSHPWDNAEPQTRPEAATAHETTPGVLQETLPGHIHHQLLEGDLQEGPATAELRAPDVTQAGASAGTGHCTAQEPGAEQGESPEEAQRMLFLRGKGAGVEEMVLNVAEHLGESMEAGEQVLMEVEGAEWLQETTAWAKPQLLGEAEEVEISQRQNLEAGLGPPEAGQEGVAVGQCLAMDEQQLGERVQAPGTALQERAEPASGLPGKLETELGEHLQPEPPSWGEAQVGAAHGGCVPEVTVAPGPGVLEEERARTEVQPRGETTDSKVLEVLPARAERAGSSRAGGEEEEVEEAEPREAEQQLQGECARGGAGWRGSVGTLEPLAAAVPPTHGQGGVGTDVELMEAQSSTNTELLAEVEADLQVWNEAGCPGTQQGGAVDPGVQLGKDKAEVGLGEEMGAAGGHSEGPSPAETPVGSPDLYGLLPGNSQALELVEADLQLSGGLSPENPQGGKGERAVQLQENEEEDGAEGQGEHGLPHEPVPHPSAVNLGQGEGAGAGLQLRENAEGLDTTEDQSTGASVQLIAEGNELRVTLGGSTEADLQPLGEAGSSGAEQGGRLDAEVQPPDQGDKAELVEGEAEDAQEDMQLSEGLSSGVPWGGEIGTNVQMEEKDGEAQGSGEDELPHEPVLDVHGSGLRKGGRADKDMQAQEEAESLDTTEEQSTGANVQLIAEGDELTLTPGGSTEADLQPLGEAGPSGTEQGGSVGSDVQPLDQEDKEQFLERKAEDVQEDRMFHEGLSPGAPWGGAGERAVQLEEEEEEEEDRAQGQGEHGLPHEPVLDLHGSGVKQGGGSGEDLQAQEEAEGLDTTEDQSTGANVQLIAEGNELKLASGERPEADLQPLSQTDSMGTEQGGNVAPDMHPLDQEGKAEVVTMEAEESWRDTQLCVAASPETPQGGGHCAAVQPRGGAGDWGQGQGGRGLMQELVPDLSGVSIRQRRGTDAGVQPVQEAVILDTVEGQSTGASVQLIAEGDELRVTPGGSTEAELHLMGEAGSSGTEQGGSVGSDVQPLDQEDKEQFLERKAEDVQEDRMFHEGLSPGAPWGGAGERAVQLEEEDGAQGQGEHGLSQEPVLDLPGSAVEHGEGAGEDLQAQEETEGLDTTEEQSTDANVQLIAEGNELKLASGERPEANLQPLGEAGSSGTEQGGRLDPEVQHLDQAHKEDILEMEVVDAQADLQLCVGLSPETPWGRESGIAVQIEEGEDGAEGQGEHGLPHEPVPHPSAVNLGQGEGAGAGLQLRENAEGLDTTEEQSTGASVQLIAEGNELRVTLGGSTEADLQPLGEAGPSGAEQGGRLDAEVQPLDQGDKAELVEGEAEDAQEDMQLSEGLSSGVPWGGEIGTNVQMEEKDGEAQGSGEDELPHEPVLDVGSGLRQGGGAGKDMQAQEEAESLDTTEEQSTGANVQLIAEGDELKLASGERPEADPQPLDEAGLSGAEQGGSVDPEMQHLDQKDKAEFLERKAEDVQEDRMFHEGLSPGAPWGGAGERAVQLEEEEEEDGAQGQGEHGLSQEPVLDLPGSAVEHGEGAGEDLQAQEEAEGLDTTEEQSTGASVQLIAEGNELRVTLGGSTEADLQPLGEAGPSGTEQGGRLDAEVQPLDQGDKAELVEGEAGDAQADLQLCVGLSPGAPWGGEFGRACQNEEDEEGGAQVQGENGLPQASVLAPEGARGRQGEGAGAGGQPQEAAESLHTLEAQSTDADVQLFTDQQMPKSGSGGNTEADLTPLGVAGLWEGQQSLTLGLGAVLGPSPTANPWEGSAAADVPPPTEASLCPEPATAAKGPGLEAKLGACIGPEGQILEAQELLQGERAPAEGKPLDGAHCLEVAQGERLEAGVRNRVKTQGLGLNQGHDDAALASLVSEVLSQLSPLTLETMMQEDVLIPDAWRLCAPGQAAQRELQEQVSAQGHEGRLHTVAQQPEGETPPTMEPEHTAAGPAEHPKQEVPPASTLHTTVRPGDAGSDQLGMVLRENSLGQRQLLGEQSKDPSVGQREKMQEFGQKMSQEGEPSSGEPGAVTAGGAGAAPSGCSKAALDPDHLYNVLFVGDSHVGKTSFLYRLHADTFNPHLTATVGLDYQIKNLVVDNKRFALRLWDSAGQERYRSMTKQFFRKADGVVLMYDITSACSFSDVRYWLSCIQEGAEDGVAVLLLGNKTDCAAQRQVPTKEGECLAKEHQLMFYECSAASGHNIFESMVSFTRLLRVREDELKNKAEEIPKAPQKKKGCCW